MKVFEPLVELAKIPSQRRKLKKFFNFEEANEDYPSSFSGDELGKKEW